MKRLKKYSMFFLCSLIITSCAQTNHKDERSEQQKSIVSAYNKVISDSTNRLTGKVENLEVQYTAWGCACPQWIETKHVLGKDSATKLIDLHFYIEPADKEMDLPLYFDPIRHRLKIEGQFYERKDYPKGTIQQEEPMPKARVFRYSKLEVIDNPTFKPQSRLATLTLIYNAISCTCAQWSEIHHKKDRGTIQRYWLEPANEKLVDADTLFNGLDLPVIIKVTGQIVCERGFPKRKLYKVGPDEADKVFRYTKINVVQLGEQKYSK